MSRVPQTTVERLPIGWFKGPSKGSAVALLVGLFVLMVPHSAGLYAQTPTVGRVDLHAHLFMEEGLGLLFRGSFAKVEARSYKDRLHSKVDAQVLHDSGNAVVVVALFAHPAFVRDLRASIRRQIRKTEQFVRDDPRWAIARNARQARELLAAGKRVLVFSLEGAAGILETKTDRDEFIDRLGVSIVTPLHLVDDHFGGAARLDGFQWVANPLVATEELLVSKRVAAVERPGRGLTRHGQDLVEDLARRGVWIDLTHASNAALKQLIPIVKRARQPLLFTHTTMRKHRRNERALAATTLHEVARSGGIIGLLPSEDAFRDMPKSDLLCPASCRAGCRGSVHAFARAFSETAAVLGSAGVMLGSDFNGGMRHLAPSCGTETAFDRTGLRHMGHSAALWQAAQRLGAPIGSAAQQLTRFLSAWDRVRPSGKAPFLVVSEGRFHGPSLPWQAGLGLRDSDAGPAVALMASMRVDKDVGASLRHSPQPFFYFAELHADFAFAGTQVPYAGFLAALFGVRARRGVVLASARLATLNGRRDTDVGRSLFLRNALLEGRLRTRIGVAGGAAVAPYVAADLGGLGYEGLVLQEGDMSHGLHVGSGKLEVGLAIHESMLRLRLFGAGSVDGGWVERLGWRRDGALRAGFRLWFCPELSLSYATEWFDAAGLNERIQRRRSMARLQLSHW